jgi:DNA-binding response OmpR family regulator
MQITKVLLVEDNELASELIYDYLIDCGFQVTPVFTATDSIAHIKNEDYDILILDVNLPDYDGFEVLKSIKNQASLPIIITSAYSDTKSKLLAFRYGASDYMVKPLDLEELEARIWIQLGKHSEIKTQENKKPFEIKGSNIFFEQKMLDLTTIEFEILSTLIKNSNAIIKREELVSSLSSISSQRSLDNHIKNIRKKINDNGNKAIYLKTIYGVGYSLHQ